MVVDLLVEVVVEKESSRLRGLVGNLRKQDAVRQVRLVRIVFDRWLREHPDAVVGRSQVRGMREAVKAKPSVVTSESEVTGKRWHPFDVDMAGRLGGSPSRIEKLRAKARAIPRETLKEIGRGDIPRASVLLDKLERMLRADAKAVREATGESLDALRANWLVRAGKVIAEHVNPTPVVPERRLRFGGPFTFISHDVRPRLEKMAERGFKVDAIITDPSYRVGFDGKRGTPMTGDDRKEPIWEPALFAKLIKPNRAICLFCNKDSLAKWTVAVLEAGLVIERLVRWHKPHAQWRGKGDDTTGDELILVCGLGMPQTFGEGASLRKITMPTLTAAERKALGVEAHRSPKPTGLMVPLVEAFTRPGETILDPFAGTGPIGVAALRGGRRYIGAEIDPVDAANTITRLQRVHEELRESRAA